MVRRWSWRHMCWMYLDCTSWTHDVNEAVVRKTQDESLSDWNDYQELIEREKAESTTEFVRALE